MVVKPLRKEQRGSQMPKKESKKTEETYFEPYPTHIVFHEDYWLSSHGTEDVEIQYINVEYVTS